MSSPSAMLDSPMYPHILETIVTHAVESAAYNDLVSLRTVSKDVKAKVDAQLFKHLTLTHVEDSFAELEVATPHGRHPALLDWPTPGAGGIYASCSTCIITNMNTTEANAVACEKCSLDAAWRHTSLSAQFKSTCVVDIIGATLMEGFKTLSSLFDTLEYIRFKPKFGVDVDMEDEEGMVWPKDMTRQAVQCGVKCLVWLGDLVDPSGLRCEAMPKVPDAHYVYVWRRSFPLEPYLDYRLEVPAGVARVSVLFHPPDGKAVAFSDLRAIQPYVDAALHGSYQLTTAGLFDTQFYWPPDDLGDATVQEYILALARDAVRRGLQPSMGDAAAAEADSRLARCTTLSMEEYAAGLSEKDRAMILEM